VTARWAPAVWIVTACAPSYPSTYAPAPPDAERADAAVSIALASDPLEAAAEELREACVRGQSVGGECAARARDACAGMTHVAHACFDAAEPKASCEALQARAIGAGRARAIGERASRAMADLCEAACETRQAGRPWTDVVESLDALCAPAR
jgi:hypothetical protein